MREHTNYRSVWNYLAEVSFRQDYAHFGGLKTRYIEAGDKDAPPLILLHGTGGHWEAFCANIGPLSQHFHVYALDMMGCGFTDKPDQPYEVKDYAQHVMRFMSSMGIPRASFIGVSLGSWVSTYIALHHPELVNRMVLVAPTGYFPLDPAFKKASQVRTSAASTPSWDNARSVLARLMYDANDVMDDLIAVRLRVYSHPDIEKLMPRMLTLLDEQMRLRNNFSDAQWQSIAAPTLLIENLDTEDVFLRTARKVVTLMPNARLAPIHETAHWAQLEQPEEFNCVALTFLKEGPHAS
jgi:2-hydroxy-6-oxonona-2,4-dienedioate hydrolase